MTNQSIFVSKTLTLLIFSCFCATHSLAEDRLYQGGDALNSSSKLTSAYDFFTLGFIRIAADGYSNYSYLGIWRTYSDVSQIQPVWLANRGKPIADDSGVLAIDEKGNMKLSGGQDVIVLYSSQSSTTNLTVVLEDSGNFVLKDANNSILWQSFDYPTDTFLSGMKLGINHRTGQTWVLTSWLSDSVPAPGAFTFQWEPSRQELVIKQRGELYWTSGPMMSNGTFKNFELTGTNYNFFNVSNADEDYFMFTSHQFSDWELKFDGGVTEVQRNGQYYFGGVLCDGNSTEKGCLKWDSGPVCRSRDRFELTTTSYNTSTISTLYNGNASLSMSDCKNICWKDCECFGVKANFYTNNTGCILLYGNYSELVPIGLPTQAYYSIVQQREGAAASQRASHGGKRNWIWIVSLVATVLTMALAGTLWYLRKRRLREMFLNELMTLDGMDDMHELENNGNRGNSLKVYRAAIIMAATNSFSEDNKLGEGGFGPVYKGKLPDGREIAIKRLSRNSGQGLVQFKNELILIAKLQHMNLVRLLGYSIQGEDKMLVYEFMPNKSLDSFIYDQSKRELLDWKERFKIIKGIVQGLLYLHQYSRLRIIHRDLKASNILLDENLNPKISDFGMARIFNTNELQANTNRIVGTYGYMSPEYAMEGIFSVKSDVFSFGVLVLEIVAGRKNRDLVHIDPPLNLAGYAWELWKEGNQFELVDPTLRDYCSKDQALRCIHVGLLCLEDNAKDRPTMSDILSMLNSEAPLPLPKQPAFFSTRNIIGMTELNSSNAGSSSINNVSMSIMEAR